MKPETEALLCARASEWIYGSSADEDGQAACQTAMAGVGFKDFEWFNFETIFTDICAFAATSDECHILAFRGTKIPQDWMTDLACTPVRFDWVFSGAPAIGEIHAGFGHCLADGLQEIKQMLIRRSSDKPLFITGHSLGGALAALAGVYFSVTGSPVPTIRRIFTFGQPRVGLHDFCNTYSRVLCGKLVRFVNKQDVVPRVPFRGFDYGDGGAMIHFDSSGTPKIESPEWRSFLARAFQSLKDVAEIVTHLSVDVGDHSVTGYRELLEKNQEQLGVLLPQACNG
jgi:Lipase (class 3)